MIVCQCNVIDTTMIEAAFRDSLDTMAATEISPEVVFKECGKEPNCGNCRSLFCAVLDELRARGGTTVQKG